MDTLTAEMKVFTASRQLHRELSQIIQARALQPFDLYVKIQILVGALQLARNRTTEAKIKVSTIWTFLDPGTMDRVFDGLGLYYHFGRCWEPMCWVLWSNVPPSWLLSCASIWEPVTVPA